ncbi:MAG TPA: tetratricopeptide repeat protein [Albitalea sp.]|uniref:tetratricopeptide repeat protein n=1 Tax=Piscinibacter sp. TaxID=1903157 RepID=UPI002ECFD10C
MLSRRRLLLALSALSPSLALAGDARDALLAAAEAALARGDAGAAIEAFDKAALMQHAPDTEMGLVRAYLQQGEYRRALAFCAHTAGAHREAPAASALYAWLLAAGGQAVFARRVLDEAAARAPGDAVLAEARRQLASALPVTTPALRRLPHRLAPQPVALAGLVPDTARVAASGVLLPGGRQALVPLGALEHRVEAVWLRNGLGVTSPGRIQRRLDGLGVALVTLDAAMAPAEGAGPAPRDPFAGSPGFVVSFAPSTDASPAWPWLHQGFVGAGRRLGIELPAGASGGAVFDAAGRWTGVAPGGDAMLGIDRLREALGDAMPVAVDGVARVPVDVIYERSLRIVMQVIV